MIRRIVLSRGVAVVVRMTCTRLVMTETVLTIGMLQPLEVRNGRAVSVHVASEWWTHQSDRYREDDNDTEKDDSG